MVARASSNSSRQLSMRATWGATPKPSAGGGSAAGAGEVLREELASAEAGGPWAIADGLGYDEVIDPRELRNALLAALRLAAGRDAGPVAPVERRGVRP